MTAPVLVENLGHDFGRGLVLDIPRLELLPGTWHLAGPNGAGKSTLLRVLATLLTPTRGSVVVAGHDARRAGASLRRSVGYAGHAPSLHPELTVDQNLALAARLHGLGPASARDAVTSWGLEARALDRVRELSFGEARRVDLARATLHRPPVLLLDEPASGLDDAARDTLARNVARAGAALVVVASHGEPAVPANARVALARGRVAEGPV